MGNRERLLETAAGLFARRGYRATSVDDILEASGVAPSNFYYHFPSKEALAYEVLERYFGQARREIVPLTQAGVPARAALERLFRFFLRRLEDQQCSVGCPLGNLAQELSDVHPGFREKLAGFFREWVDAVADLLRRGIRRGELRPGLDPEATAFLVVGLIQGLVLLSKNLKTPGPARRGFRQIQALLERTPHRGKPER